MFIYRARTTFHSWDRNCKLQEEDCEASVSSAEHQRKLISFDKKVEGIISLELCTQGAPFTNILQNLWSGAVIINPFLSLCLHMFMSISCSQALVTSIPCWMHRLPATDFDDATGLRHKGSFSLKMQVSYLLCENTFTINYLKSPKDTLTPHPKKAGVAVCSRFI